MEKIIVEKSAEGHPAKAWGFNYNVKVVVDGFYSGSGKFCKTLEDVERYKNSIK